MKKVNSKEKNSKTEVKNLSDDKKNKNIEILRAEANKIREKKNKIMFYSVDCKNNSSNSVFQLYSMANHLYELGYNVQIVFHTQDNDEYEGIGNVFGEKYMQIPHIDLSKEKNYPVNISDILIIPEIFNSVLEQTAILPCTRVVLCQNFNFMAEVLPMGKNYGEYKILDAITTSETQKRLLNEIFPYLNIQVIEPSISPCFYEKKSKLKTLQVGIVTQDTASSNRICKLFSLKYPQMSFVTFRALNGLSQEVYAEELQNCACVVVDDPETNFGISILEALRCRTIPIAIIPQEPITDWMVDSDGKMCNEVIWVPNLNKVHMAISTVLSGYMNDMIPEDFMNNMGKYDDKYTREEQKIRTKEVIDGYNERRLKEIEDTLLAVTPS